MIRNINKLTVLHNELEVGVLRQTPDGANCTFEYSKSWLESGFSLSPTELPIQKGLIYADQDKFEGGFAAFEDSLPDGYGLYLLDRMLRRQGISLKSLTPLQRLALIGDSAMGALRYVPSVKLEENQLEIKEDDMDILQSKAIETLSEKTEGDESLLYYASGNSGGARPKVMRCDTDGKHWIVKFRHTYDPIDVGKEEYAYMRAARECGIVIPEIKLINGKYFAIERFDIENGKRVHVLTAAALLKTDYRRQEADYTNLLALTGYLTQNPQQVEQMFRRMVFNVVCENRDDHAKNFSFLCHDGVWSLAPAYDITYSPKGSNGQHATSLFYDGNPSDELMIKAGTKIRIPKTRCEEIISEIRSTASKYLKR